MVSEKRITTRELLRGFKKYKEMLLQGKIMHIVVSVGSGEELEVHLRQKNKTAASAARTFRNASHHIRVKRNKEIFEGLIKPR